MNESQRARYILATVRSQPRKVLVLRNLSTVIAAPALRQAAVSDLVTNNYGRHYAALNSPVHALMMLQKIGRKPRKSVRVILII